MAEGECLKTRDQTDSQAQYESIEFLSSLCQCLWLLALTLWGRSVKAAIHNCECVICAALILLQTPGFLFLDMGLVVLTGDEHVQLAPLHLCRGQRPSVPAVPPTPSVRRTRWRGFWQSLVAILCVSWHPAGIMISVLICLSACSSGDKLKPSSASQAVDRTN